MRILEHVGPHQLTKPYRATRISSCSSLSLLFLLADADSRSHTTARATSTSTDDPNSFAPIGAHLHRGARDRRRSAQLLRRVPMPLRALTLHTLMTPVPRTQHADFAPLGAPRPRRRPPPRWITRRRPALALAATSPSLSCAPAAARPRQHACVVVTRAGACPLRTRGPGTSARQYGHQCQRGQVPKRVSAVGGR